MYREPAEDQEAKLDAAEVAAFRAKMGRARMVQRSRVIYAVVLGCVVLATAVAFASRYPDHYAIGRAADDPDCHVVYDINVDPSGALSPPTERIVCRSDAGPSREAR